MSNQNNKVQIEELYNKQSEMVNSIMKDDEFKDYEGIHDSFFTPPPLLTSKPKLILVGLEPSWKANEFIKNIDWLSSFENFTLHYAAWKSCGETFDYHFTDISKLSLRAKDASKVRKKVFKRFLPLFIDEVNLMRKNQNDCIVVCTKSIMTLLRRGRVIENLNFLYTIMHWSTRISNNEYFKYFEENNIPLPSFTENEFETIYETITDFSEKLMLELNFTAEEVKDRKEKILTREAAWKYVKHRTCVFFYYTHCFADFLGTN